MIKQIEVYHNDFSHNVTKKNSAVKYLFEKIGMTFAIFPDRQTITLI